MASFFQQQQRPRDDVEWDPPIGTPAAWLAPVLRGQMYVDGDLTRIATTHLLPPPCRWQSCTHCMMYARYVDILHRVLADVTPPPGGQIVAMRASADLHSALLVVRVGDIYVRLRTGSSNMIFDGSAITYSLPSNLWHFECYPASWRAVRPPVSRAKAVLDAVLDHLTDIYAAQQRRMQWPTKHGGASCVLGRQIARSAWMLPEQLKTEILNCLSRKTHLYSAATPFRGAERWPVFVFTDCPRPLRPAVLRLLAEAHALFRGDRTGAYECADVRAPLAEGLPALFNRMKNWGKPPDVAARDGGMIGFISHSLPTSYHRMLWSDTPWPREVYRALDMQWEAFVPARAVQQTFYSILGHLFSTVFVYFRASASASNADEDRRLREIATLDFTFPPAAVT